MSEINRIAGEIASEVQSMIHRGGDDLDVWASECNEGSTQILVDDSTFTDADGTELRCVFTLAVIDVQVEPLSGDDE